MPCFHPLKGYRARRRTESGKRAVTFNVREGYRDLEVQVPCGGCIGCRLERSRQWAMRCVHEASLYDENCFVTLTYGDEHLPEYGSLKLRDWQLFMKRLRKRVRALDEVAGRSPRKVRFFHAGEYGDVTGRPHYHALLFNFDFPDRVPWRKGAWRSPLLEELWPLGNSEIGEVTFESAAYVARYCVKKVNGPAAREHYERVDGETGEVVQLAPEYATMSRRPGIGHGWYDRWKCEVFPWDEVVMRGKAMKPPKYYDLQLEKEDLEAYEAVKKLRRMNRRRGDESEERLTVRELNAIARLNLKGVREC